MDGSISAITLYSNTKLLISLQWMCIDFKGRLLIKVMKFSRNRANSRLDRLVSSFMEKMDSG